MSCTSVSCRVIDDVVVCVHACRVQLDPTGRLWLLWCSSVRVDGGPSSGGDSAVGSSLLAADASVPPDVRLSSVAPIPKVLVDRPRSPIISSSASLGALGTPSATAMYPAPPSITGAGGQRLSPGHSRPIGGGALGSTSHHFTSYAFLSNDKHLQRLITEDTVSMRRVLPDNGSMGFWLWILWVVGLESIELAERVCVVGCVCTACDCGTWAVHVTVAMRLVVDRVFCAAVQCPSCGSSMSISSPSGAEVAFRIIITHYNQVLRVIGLSPYNLSAASSSTTSSASAPPEGDGDEDGVGASLTPLDDNAVVPSDSVWPNEALALSTSGGVGLFGVYTHLDPSAKWVKATDGGQGAGATSGSSTTKLVPPRLVVSEIPPPIKLVLPNLTVEEYRKLKRDSAFLLRTLRTCEGCFLVYAQVCAACSRVFECAQ